MAAITGRQEFINNLTGFLKKANLSDTQQVWYSFYPHVNQPNEFVFNDLLEESLSFLQKVTRTKITNIGSGYGSSETPVVTFTSIDAGQFASGTANMSASTNTITNQLVKSWPISITGSNLIFNGTFASLGTGWYLNSGGLNPAGDSGLLYKFESGGLHIYNVTHVNIDFTNNLFTLSPNSGTLPSVGNGMWVEGSIDVISGDALTTLQVFGLTIDLATTGTKYFARWLRTGITSSPTLTFTCQSGSNVFVDNFTYYTGDIGGEIINGLSGEYISNMTPDSNGLYFSGINGKTSGLGIFKSAPPASSPASFDIQVTGTDALHTRNYTMAFWHYFKNQNGGLPLLSNNLVATWAEGNALTIAKTQYRLINSSLGSIILVPVAPSDGWHLIALGLSQSTPSSPITQFISIDNEMFSGEFPLINLKSISAPLRFYGPSDNYDVGVDDLSIWNRALTTGEINQLWNNGTGFFSPYSGGSAGSLRSVLSITLTNGGINYLLAPNITIAAPTGGGIQATATASLGADTGRIYAESFPGLSVGGTNFVITGMQSGTGIFNSGNNDFLRVGNHIPFSDFTAFLNFNPSGHVKGKHQVLLASMDSVNQQSGFLLSINDSNRLVFEYVDNTNLQASGTIRRHRIHDEELGKNNLIAISKDDTHKVLTICFHDLADHDTRSKSYSIEGYTDSNFLFLGGFTNSGNNTNYTGFAGNFYDFLLLSGAADAVQCDALYKVFFTTGYTPSGTTGVPVAFPLVTGVTFQTTITGSGITGYNISGVTIPDKDGIDITVYDTFALTGNLSGTGIVYLSGGSGFRTVQSSIPEQFLFSDSYIKNYSEAYLVLLNYAVVNTDMLEVYSFNDKQIDKISVLPEPFNLNDFYLLNTFDSDNLALVFNDGILQVDSVNYTVASGKIVSNGLSAFHSSYNFLMYDEISGDMFISGWTGWSGVRQIIGTGDHGWTSKVASGAGQQNGDEQLAFTSSFVLEGFQWDNVNVLYDGDKVTFSGTAGTVSAQEDIIIQFGIINNGQFTLIRDEFVTYFEQTGTAPSFVYTTPTEIPISGYPAFRYLSTYTGDSLAQDIHIYRTSSVVRNKRDIYLNGQKLVSGFDFISTGSGITLTGVQNGLPVVWASGTFAFPNSRTGNRAIFTGSGIGFYKDFSTTTIGTLMDEMVWLNGQRLVPDFDYKKVSSMSLLLSTTRPTGLQFQLYTGDIWPSSILTGRPNL